MTNNPPLPIDLFSESNPDAPLVLIDCIDGQMVGRLHHWDDGYVVVHALVHAQPKDEPIVRVVMAHGIVTLTSDPREIANYLQWMGMDWKGEGK